MDSSRFSTDEKLTERERWFFTLMIMLVLEGYTGIIFVFVNIITSPCYYKGDYDDAGNYDYDDTDDEGGGSSS